MEESEELYVALTVRAASLFHFFIVSSQSFILLTDKKNAVKNALSSESGLDSIIDVTSVGGGANAAAIR